MIPVDVLARIALLPLLLAQAVNVRRKAVFLPEPPGKRSGREGSGPPLRLLIAGDSAAAGVGAPSQSAAVSGQLVAALASHYQVDWRLEANTGATTRTSLDKLSQLPPEPFDIAIIAVGVNDVTRVTTRHQWIVQQNALHQLLQDRFGVTRILACGLPPMGLFPLLPQPLRWILGQQANRLDRALAALAAHNAVVQHLPFEFPRKPGFFAEDGYHPSEMAHAFWAKVLAKEILLP
jgi:lysophospholipase L1-like esterase